MKGQYKYKKNIFIIIPALVLSIFFLYYFLSSFFVSFFNTGISVKNNFEKTRQQLVIENDNLKKDIEIFKQSEKVIKLLEHKNKKLEEELRYKKENEINREKFALTFSEESNIFSSVLILDPEEKTRVGDLVFSHRNFLIGKISEKILNISKIKLFSLWGEKNNFYLQDSGNVKLKVEGVGDGSGVIKVEIPRNIKFSNYDDVFLLYENNISYTVGYLADIKFKTQDTGKTLFFKIFINPSLINQVQVESEVEQLPETVKIYE